MSYTHTCVQFPRCTDVNYHGFHGTRRSKQADGEKRKKRGVTGSWRRAGSTSSSLPVFTVYRLDVSRWPSNVGRRADNLSVRLFWMFSDGGHMVAVHRRLNLRLFLSPPLSSSLSLPLSHTHSSARACSAGCFEKESSRVPSGRRLLADASRFAETDTHVAPSWILRREEGYVLKLFQHNTRHNFSQIHPFKVISPDQSDLEISKVVVFGTTSS